MRARSTAASVWPARLSTPPSRARSTWMWPGRARSVGRVVGSITVDGCSLTVVETLDDGFTVAVIPHTAAVTTLGSKGKGDRVNLEVDMVAKYIERLWVGREARS